MVAKELRNVAQARERVFKANELLADAIRAARAAGFSLRAVASEAGVTHETVRRFERDDA